MTASDLTDYTMAGGSRGLHLSFFLALTLTLTLIGGSTGLDLFVLSPKHSAANRYASTGSHFGEARAAVRWALRRMVACYGGGNEVSELGTQVAGKTKNVAVVAHYEAGMEARAALHPRIAG